MTPLTALTTPVAPAILGMDPTFAALGLPQPPPLNNVDPTKIEEIRRTVYVGNLDSGVSLTLTIPNPSKSSACFCMILEDSG